MLIIKKPVFRKLEPTHKLYKGNIVTSSNISPNYYLVSQLSSGQYYSFNISADGNRWSELITDSTASGMYHIDWYKLVTYKSIQIKLFQRKENHLSPGDIFRLGDTFYKLCTASPDNTYSYLAVNLFGIGKGDILFNSIKPVTFYSRNIKEVFKDLGFSDLTNVFWKNKEKEYKEDKILYFSPFSGKWV